tara:strand:+ start:280 stop:2235 length:1956 start_codon:yes stop_codon:yes gene_type:complete
MKWIGQHIYDQISKFRNTVDFSEDVTFYQPVNDANPDISIGASDDERLRININYQGTATQLAQIISFKTYTESATAHDGRFVFGVDEVNILQIRDDGINLYENMGISINGTDILTDSSGTATLSNIDALDATTIATFNAALSGDITGVTAGTGLSGGGTSGAVTLNVDAAQTQITSLGTLTALDVDNININGDTITASGDMALVATGNDITVDTDNFTIESATATKPSFTLKTSADANKPSVFNFVKDKGGAGAAGDVVGGTNYISDNDAQEQITMVSIQGGVSDATDGAEEGEYRVAVKNTANAVIPENSFVLTGNGVHTDATIGSGTSSVTTLTGTLTMGSTAFVNNSGVIQVATQGTIDHDSLANFVANEHIDWTGSSAGTIHSSNIPTLNQSTTGQAGTVATIAGLAPNTATTQASQPNITGVGTIGTGVWNATAIASAKMATGTSSAQGALELATTAEATTGTDTARAITAAGLKSHVDARHSYSYISFTGQSTVQSDGNWEYLPKQGIASHAWNNNGEAAGITVGDSTIAVDKTTQHNGIRVPHACTLIGFSGLGSNASGNRTFHGGLFVGVPDYNDTDAINPVLRAYAAASGSSHGNRTSVVEDLGRTYSLSAGDVIYPAIRGNGSNADNIYLNFTVVLKVPII